MIAVNSHIQQSKQLLNAKIQTRVKQASKLPKCLRFHGARCSLQLGYVSILCLDHDIIELKYHVSKGFINISKLRWKYGSTFHINLFVVWILKLSNKDAEYITINHFNVLPKVKHTEEEGISLVIVLFRAV
jgi:hypothetical protein